MIKKPASRWYGFFLLIEALLFSRKINIFLMPEGKGRVRQISLPLSLCLFLAPLLVICLVFVLWLVHDYTGIKARAPRLAELKKENALQKEQLLYMARRIDQVTREMGELRALDHKLRVMVNLETGEGDDREKGLGGPAPALLDPEKTLKKVDRDLARSMHRALDNIESDLSASREDKAGLREFLENQKMLLAATPSIWPAKGWLSSRFGYRKSPFTGKKEFHKGLDISARMGSPVVASADGTVSFSGWDRGYGRLVVINHGYGLKSKYAHLKKSLVKKGQYVKRGETIGLIGKSGRTTGPHLHYEVLLNGVPVNPLRYVLN
ncbi:MAG: M23 family metallopeptidase [Deltaproteobacteria bacterium]|nr:M23 family metallopeptidase [Deltaproteobacteria bacterium]MBW2113018.1 M23 family metallopeptidase [Deltaproteobacteria bacterium]MBW2354242.1 M23 family metallopeptidase [Deltaproteobacteria bacterium]HDZ90128.1 peptidase M24 [Deltaproteobacteria bacterium]